MYTEILDIWRKEKLDDELQALNPNFYSELIGSIKEKNESPILDKKDLKGKLLKDEMDRVEKIILDIIELRFQKIIKAIMRDELPSKVLTEEETIIHKELMKSFQFLKGFNKRVIKEKNNDGQKPIENAIDDSKILVRFVKDVPTIMGIDMKKYGPFKKEDVATLLVDNAKTLIDRGIAIKVEADN